LPLTDLNYDIEVSVFSRGIGECILVKYDPTSWIIVDSLIDETGNPVALTYLEKEGIDLDFVKLIALSHWHDDHVKGAAKLAAECKNALISYPSVLKIDEFNAVVSKQANVSNENFKSGVSELIKVAQELQKDRSRRRYASAQRILLEFDKVRVEALSPSDEDHTLFMEEMRVWMDAPPTEKLLVKPSRNDTSVSLAIQIDDDVLLLGGDLEVRNKLSGWQAVHEISWNNRPKATLFKIPHHGSVTGEYGPVWDDMVRANPLAVLTPYGRGVKKLPCDDDIARLTQRTDHCYSASDGHLPKASRRANAVERTLSEGGISIFKEDMRLGQVRIRKKKSTDEWAVELFGSALKLKAAAYTKSH
jgi:hypothetical protein